LQSDPNLEVQMTAVDSLADWSDVLAIPLLLQSLAESSLRTRQFALAELEHRRGGGLPFPLYADPQERAVRAKQWAVEWQLPDTLVSAIQELSQPGNARLDAIRLAELRDRIGTLRGPLTGESRTAETNRLLPELTAADVSLLEILLSEVNESQRDLLLHEILPRLSPAYDALVQLEEPDSRRRQAAATKLAQIGADISLSPVLLQHLQRLMRQEQDRLVWRSVMQAVTPDASDQAGQLALLAINSTWPDVRVLGCDYVARHGQSEQAVWLLPLLHDSSRLVQSAAIRAAGECGNPVVLDGLQDQSAETAKGLRPLLAQTQGATRFAVIRSMSRLGDHQAMQELVRMSFDANPATRLDVVRAMGDTGHSRFVEPLVRLAWTEPDHHVRQGAVAALERLVPVNQRPAGLANAKSLAETVSLWNDWWTAQARATGLRNAHEGTHDRYERQLSN
jgi:HEAT repeat protein